MTVGEFAKVYNPGYSRAALIHFYIYEDIEMYNRGSFFYHLSKVYRADDELSTYEMMEEPYASAKIVSVNVYGSNVAIHALLEV